MTNKTALLFASMFLFTMVTDRVAAQQRFKAGLIFGLNASQIMGDDTGGYHKLGLQGGLRATTVLKDKMDLSFELLYSQRGSYDKYGSPVCFDGTLLIRLQYVEVPVVFSYKDWYIEDEDYYKVQASAGLSYSRLIQAKAEGSCHDDITDLFNSNDYGFTTGVEYFATRHISFGARWSRSFNLLFNKDKHEGLQGRNSLRGYFLSFRGAYTF
jgi:hypothetical protein